MKNIILSFFVCLVFGHSAFAKTPPEVLTPYKAYMAALEDKDAEAARKYAYEAWQKAEDLMGDSKTTGDLALNFAMLKAKKRSTVNLQEDAFERVLELVKYQEDPESSFLERGIEFMTFYQGHKKSGKSYKIAKLMTDYAEDKQRTQSTFYAEALTTRAGYYASKARHKKAEEMAVKALEAFESADDDILSAQPILAQLYRGYGLEGQQKSLDAALSYQEVMETLDGIEPNEHPLAAKALGRWSQMRSVLYSEGKLEEAEQLGLCRCWPYNKPRNESLKPIKRFAGKVPKGAWVSGFTIVEFDLDDEGRPINIDSLVSWPEELYKKTSLKAVKRWRYTPKTKDETIEDRTDLIVTIRYKIVDEFGNLVH